LFYQTNPHFKGLEKFYLDHTKN